MLLAGSKRFGYEPQYLFRHSEGALDLSVEMLVSFLRRCLGSVLLVLHRHCVVCCATEAVALAVMLLSLPLRCLQHCVDLAGALSCPWACETEAVVASSTCLSARSADL